MSDFMHMTASCFKPPYGAYSLATAMSAEGRPQSMSPTSARQEVIEEREHLHKLSDVMALTTGLIPIHLRDRCVGLLVLPMLIGPPFTQEARALHVLVLEMVHSCSSWHHYCQPCLCP